SGPVPFLNTHENCQGGQPYTLLPHQHSGPALQCAMRTWAILLQYRYSVRLRPQTRRGSGYRAAVIWPPPPRSMGSGRESRGAPGALPAAEDAAPGARPQISAKLDSAPAPRRALRPEAVLYDQSAADEFGGVNSQKYEAALADYDAQAADDFIVPAGQSWTVN